MLVLALSGSDHCLNVDTRAERRARPLQPSSADNNTPACTCVYV